MVILRNIVNDVYALAFTILIILSSIVQSNIHYLKLDMNLVIFLLSFAVIVISMFGLLILDASLPYMGILLNISLIISLLPENKIIPIIIFMCTTLIMCLWVFNKNYWNECNVKN